MRALDPRDIPIDDLEVSVRTMGVLMDLGVETVAELIALPVIRASRLSVAELRELLQDMGLGFEGRWEVLSDPVLVHAEGSVLERWATISAWLADHHPGALRTWRPPAAEAAIVATEATLGRGLPLSYRRFLAVHNGQTPDGAWVWTAPLWPVEELPRHYRRLAALLDDPERGVADVPEAIRAVPYSEGWVPIGVSARGRDFLCLDLDPGPSGAVGQVILVSIDADEHLVVAASFEELLAVFFEEAQLGEIYLEDDA